MCLTFILVKYILFSLNYLNNVICPYEYIHSKDPRPAMKDLNGQENDYALLFNDMNFHPRYAILRVNGPISWIKLTSAGVL